MSKLTKKDVLKIILSSAKLYKMNLENKNLLSEYFVALDSE